MTTLAPHRIRSRDLRPLRALAFVVILVAMAAAMLWGVSQNATVGEWLKGKIPPAASSWLASELQSSEDEAADTESLVAGNQDVLPNEAPRDTMSSADISVTSVSVVEVTPAVSSQISRTYSGVVRAAQTSDLGFKRIDRVKRMYVDEGERVKKGDVLAELDVRSLIAQRAGLKAELNAAQARLAELNAGPRTEVIAAAKASLEELRSLTDLARITASRRGRLVAENAVSQQELDDATLQLAASENRFRSQQQVVRELEAGTRKEQIAAQEAMVEKLKASFEQIEIEIEESKLRAPYDAIVARRLADEGMIVSPGTVILRLVQHDDREAWIGLPVAIGKSMELDADYELAVGDETVTARLRSVLPELDSVTRTQPAVFVIGDDAKPSFGQVVRFEWSEEQSLEGFWLPTTALTHGIRGLWSVFVVTSPESGDEVVDENNNTALATTATDSQATSSESGHLILERRDVEVLRIETDRVLLRGTLRPGDRVVASGVQKFVAGQVVEISRELETENF